MKLVTRSFFQLSAELTFDAGHFASKRPLWPRRTSILPTGYPRMVGCHGFNAVLQYLEHGVQFTLDKRPHRVQLISAPIIDDLQAFCHGRTNAFARRPMAKR